MGGVDVGVAETRSLDLDENLAGVERPLRHLLDPKRLGEVVATAARYVPAGRTTEAILSTVTVAMTFSTATGRSSREAYGSLRRGGTLVFVALPAANHLTIPIFETVLNGITIAGSIVGTRDGSP